MDDPFALEFISTGDGEGPPDLYTRPKPGLRMTYERHPMGSGLDGMVSHYYKAKIIQDTETPMVSRDIILKTVYFSHGPDCLVAANVEVKPGVLVTETITVTRDAAKKVTGLHHQFMFSTGQSASWGCSKKP